MSDLISARCRLTPRSACIVAQEALHNVVKHAHARSAQVSLTRRDGHLAMSIQDDGRGFEVETAGSHRGLGLMSLDERVRMLDGTFALTTSLQAGTTVSVTIPVGECKAAV